ncbi:TPA: DivIVA domain-containing protein [Candidatus Poribacteria bacterium]|nr:DivIVA domain-containing protein [Candidatus Poribacteria bacterium]
MRIQPNDILNKEFKKTFRGLDPDDVIDFLDQIYEDYEFFYNENEELKRKIAELELKTSNIDDTVNIEDMLQQAEDMYNQKIREAEKESRNIIQQARLEAQKIIDDAIANARKQEEAEQTANEIIEKANADADNIRKSAEKEAELIIQQAQEKANAITKEAEEKALEVEQIRQNMKSAEDTIQNAHKEAEQIIQNAQKEAEQIIQNAQSQLAKEKEVTEVFDLKNFKDLNPILDQARIKAYEIIEKAKTNEIEYKREVLRLKNQKERYIMGYKELLSRQIKSADDEIEA